SLHVRAVGAAPRLETIEPVQARNELARDAFSYVHLPMVAAIVLVAVGIKATLEDLDRHLVWPMTAALFGGAALYLVAHVAFKLRGIGVLSRPRVGPAIALLLLLPAAH